MLSPDLLPEPAMLVDATGRVVTANEAARCCFGRPLDAVALGDLVADAATRLGLIADAPGGESWRAEVEGRRANGVPFPLDVSGRRLDGDPAGHVLVLLRDRNADGGAASLSQRYFDAAFDSSPIGMALYTTDGEFARVNDAMCRLVGRGEAELLGTRDQLITHPDDREADLIAAERILAGELEVHQAEKRFLRPDGEVVWAMANLSFLRDEQDRPLAWLGQFQDVTAHRLLAERDPLTGLANRRRFETALDEHLRHSARYSPLGALIIFDLDGLKTVNDQHGHVAGDAALRAVADAVQGRLRDTDVLARLGGDEFAVILPHANPDEAQVVGRAIVDLVAGLAHDVTASVGLAPFAPSLGEASLVVSAADAALYEAKRAGGDDVRTALA